MATEPVFKRRNGPSERGQLDENSYEYIKLEAMELKQILVTLTEKYKTAEDRRKLLERTTGMLTTDNKELRQQCLSAESRRILAEKEVGELQDKVDRLSSFLLSPLTDQEKEEVRLSRLVDKATSCKDLRHGSGRKAASESSSGRTVSQNRGRNGSGGKKEAAATAPKMGIGRALPNGTIVLTKQELHQLDGDMHDLREALEKREEAWTRTAERERLHRVRLSKLTAELNNLRNLNGWKSNELDFKSRELKAKTQELAAARKEMIKLKAQVKTTTSGLNYRGKGKGAKRKNSKDGGKGRRSKERPRHVPVLSKSGLQALKAAKTRVPCQPAQSSEEFDYRVHATSSSEVEYAIRKFSE